MTFADLRQKVGRQEDLAKLLGVTRHCVSKWEIGSSAPKTKDIEHIAKVLGVSVADLIEALKNSRTQFNH